MESGNGPARSSLRQQRRNSCRYRAGHHCVPRPLGRTGAQSRLAPGNPPRLTQTRYFQKEHRKIPRAIWSRSDVRSPANCGACHQQADRGIFDDETIKLPGVEKWREND
ncbi:hypothetical protein [Hydrogenophilus thermoluteolus]|uniref:hypothetical protein n=1 Tax=Hydrogenophilus thermoluteolus TaxID=297 RepID=UPI003F66BA59